MAGPLGYGVADGLRGRKRREMPPPAPGRSWRRFVAITFALSWLATAAIGGPPASAGEAPAWRLFWACAYYAGVMAWPPLLGTWLTRWADGGVAPDVPTHRPASRRDVTVAIAVATALVVAAAVTTVALDLNAALGLDRLEADAGTALAIAGVLVVLAAQALSEERGWRGGSLDWAIARWGRRAGLIIHGAAWGLWYAPLFVVSATTTSTGAGTLAAFSAVALVAGAGLGVVLGWIRLRSQSLVPAAVANALLTVLAGVALLPGAAAA